MTGTCGTCEYYDQINGGDYGRCLRYPPTILSVPDRMIVEGAIDKRFPIMHNDEVCGEHKGGA